MGYPIDFYSYAYSEFKHYKAKSKKIALIQKKGFLHVL